MPGHSFYEGLDLGEQLAKFTAHHHDPVTRHISSFESEMLKEVGGVVSSTASNSVRSAKHGGGSIVLVAGGVLAITGVVLGRNLYLARRRSADGPGRVPVEIDLPPDLPEGESS